ncbi:MAG: tail fiber domain-containing protein [bacterium]
MIFSAKKIKKTSSLAFVLAMFFLLSTLLCAPFANADVPNIISYQGTLSDTGGNTLGGAGTTYYFKFSFWDSPTVGSGTKVWPTSAPTAIPLTVRHGSFNVRIGDTDASYPDTLDYNWNSSQKVYLQIEISSNNTDFETLSPRSIITSAPFSQVSNQVNGTNPSSFGTSTPFLNTLISALSNNINSAVMTIKGMVGQVASLFNIKDSNDNTLFTVTADGKVGVGTATPGVKLAVAGSKNSTLLQLRSGFDSGGDYNNLDFINTATSDTVAVRISAIANSGVAWSSDLGLFSNPGGSPGTAPVERIRILNNGNIGIGTTTPSAKLQITGTAGSADIFAVSSSTNSRLFTIGANGNVGIGTAAPSAKLTILGGSLVVRELDDENDALRFDAGNVSSALRMYSNGALNTQIHSDTGNPTYFNAGNVGIGNTTPSAKLHITGTAGSADIFAVSSSTNSRLFTIGANGNVGVGTSTPVSKLSVVGDSYVSGNSTIGDKLYFSGASSYSIDAIGGQLNFKLNNNAVATINSIYQGEIASSVANGGFSIFGDVALRRSSAGVFEIDNNTLGSFRDLNLRNLYSSGNVGIGTTTPSAKLHITGTAGSADIFAVSSSTNSRLFTIGANGNVGVGTLSPSSALTLSSVSGTNMIDFRDSAFNQSRLSLSLDSGGTGNLYSYNSGFIFNAGSPASGYAYDFRLNNSSILRIGYSNIGIGTTTPSAKLDITGTAGSADIFAVSSSTNSRLFTIGANGNVGVGTASPTNTLDIIGGFRVANGTGNSISVSSGYGDPGVSLASQYSMSIHSGTGGLLLAAGAYGILMQSRVFINPPNGYTAPGAQLQLNTPASTTIGQIIKGSTSQSADLLQFQNSTGTALSVFNSNGWLGIGTTTPSAQLHTTGTIRFASLGAGSLQTDANGNVTVSSDEKLKNIQGDFTRGLSDLIKINPISYKWNTLSGYDTNSTYSGFSAQNIQLAIPEAVATSSNGFLSLSDRPILATVINAVKEIFEKISGFANLIETKILKTDKVETKELCIEDVCVTKIQLQQVLQNQNIQGSTPTSIPAPTAIIPESPAPSSTPTTTPETPVVPEEPTATPLVEDPTLAPETPATPSEPAIEPQADPVLPIIEPAVEPTPTPEAEAPAGV